MDATVDDFLKEINQISSKNDLKASKEPSETQKSEVWNECFDELTGYSYFWNTETDEVTWVPPKSYKPAENGPKKANTPRPNLEKEKKKPEMFFPPRTTTTEYSNTSVKPEAKLKVYSIQDTIKKPQIRKSVSVSFNSSRTSSGPPPQPKKKGHFRKHEDSDDEKIELITEYGGESDSDSNENTTSSIIKQKKIIPRPIVSPSPTRKVSPPIRTLCSSIIMPTVAPKETVSAKQRQSQSDNDDDDDDDDIDLLAKIQQRAQELKKLGGEVPAGVKQIIQIADVKKTDEKPKPISGFSLVAGYNSDSSDSESEKPEHVPPKTFFPVAPPPPVSMPETSHSTLFPITTPIDVQDFIGPEPPPSETVKVTENNEPSNNFDSKAFQRKRRIGISLVNNSVKRSKEDAQPPENNSSGFGFKSEISQIVDTKEDAPSTYTGFQKGGVMFVKSDVLNPTVTIEEKKIEKVESQDKTLLSSIDKTETEDVYSVLREKLLFLGEGKAPVLPVQVMLIQAETLFLAMKEGGLMLSYLHKWLKEMCSELIKLEKEAAPEGWLLQWDRSHKRYFYQNQTTGVSQWRYPEPDVNRCNEAMDICTTPPPPDLPPDAKLSSDDNPVSPVMFGPQLPIEPPLPPSPPQISSPTPPPPPMISMEEPKSSIPDVPLPPEPPLPEPLVIQPPLPPLENSQPLPPGVDLPPEVYNKPKEPEVKSPDTLITALDSFYSEIAEVAENTNSSSPKSSSQISKTPAEGALEYLYQHNNDLLKKRKKKVKLAQGLTMKKKGVSQLVEKWKNVQNNYGD